MKVHVHIIAAALVCLLWSCSEKAHLVHGLSERTTEDAQYIEDVKNSGVPYLDLFNYRPFYTPDLTLPYFGYSINPDLPEPFEDDGPGRVKVMYVSADAGDISIPYKSFGELYCVSTAKPPYLFSIDKEHITGQYRNCFPKTEETVGDTTLTMFRTDLFKGKSPLYGDPSFFCTFHPAEYSVQGWHVDATASDRLNIHFDANPDNDSRLLAVSVGWIIAWNPRDKYVDWWAYPSGTVATRLDNPEYEAAKGPWHPREAIVPATDFHMYRTLLIFQAGQNGDTGEADFNKGAQQWKYLSPFVGPCVHYEYDGPWVHEYEREQDN